MHQMPEPIILRTDGKRRKSISAFPWFVRTVMGLNRGPPKGYKSEEPRRYRKRWIRRRRRRYKDYNDEGYDRGYPNYPQPKENYAEYRRMPLQSNGDYTEPIHEQPSNPPPSSTPPLENDNQLRPRDDPRPQVDIQRENQRNEESLRSNQPPTNTQTDPESPSRRRYNSYRRNESHLPKQHYNHHKGHEHREDDNIRQRTRSREDYNRRPRRRHSSRYKDYEKEAPSNRSFNGNEHRQPNQRPFQGPPEINRALRSTPQFAPFTNAPPSQGWPTTPQGSTPPQPTSQFALFGNAPPSQGWPTSPQGPLPQPFPPIPIQASAQPPPPLPIQEALLPPPVAVPEPIPPPIYIVTPSSTKKRPKRRVIVQEEDSSDSEDLPPKRQKKATKSHRRDPSKEDGKFARVLSILRKIIERKAGEDLANANQVGRNAQTSPPAQQTVLPPQIIVAQQPPAPAPQTSYFPPFPYYYPPPPQRQT